MEIYLNGHWICRNAYSVKFPKTTNYSYDNKHEYYSNGGKPFTVTVTLCDSTEKEYKVGKCMIVRSDEFSFYTKRHHYEPTKVYLNT